MLRTTPASLRWTLSLLCLVGCSHERTGTPQDLGGTDIGSFVEGKKNGASCAYNQGASTSNLGTDFYVIVPSVFGPIAGACFAAFVANPSSDPVTIGVERGGVSFDPSTFAYIPDGTGPATTYTPLSGATIPPGSVAILFLNHAPQSLPPMQGTNYSCPPGIKAAVEGSDAATLGTGRGPAFHITASAPVAAYDIYPYGGGQTALTSATMLIPTNAWDTNYVAVDAIGKAEIFAGFWIALVGEEDNTQVTIRPKADIAGGMGVPAAMKDVPQTYTVNKGEVLQFEQDTPLAGSIIQSTANIGVWGGKQMLAIESCCNDSAHQQIPPVRAFGNEYVAARYRERYEGNDESVPWRIVGAVDGTELFWDPAPPSGAPTTLQQGEVVDFESPGQFVVSSADLSHPFYLATHMTGAAKYDYFMNDGRGDAEWVNVVPTGEYATSYVFFTDPTYPETDLVLVRQVCDDTLSDVILDCAGAVTGWAPVGNGTYEIAHVDLIRHNFEGIDGCSNGRHEIHSDRPFALTVWGWGSAETGDINNGFYSQYVSYAYPGGANLTPINNVVVIP